MIRRTLLLLAGACLMAPGALPYIRVKNRAGVATSRTDYANIQFLLNQNFVAGFTNNDGTVNLTPDTDVMGALNGALAAWSSIPTGAVQFLPVQPTSLLNDPSDGQDVIVMADTPAIRSALGPVLAATTAVNSFRATGIIFDTDIIFNPVLTFSSTSVPNTFDLQSVFTATLGFALGEQNSAVIASSVSNFIRPGETFRQILSPDDIAFVSGLYPAPGSTGYGTLGGSLTLNGSPLRNALITAVDASGSGTVISTLTSEQDGTWSVAVPAGNYLVYTQPVVAAQDLPLGLPSDAILPSYIGLQLGVNVIDTNFDPSFLGGNGSSATVTVIGGAASDASFSPAPAGSTQVVTLLDIAAVPVGGTGNITIGRPVATQLVSGQSYDFVIQGLAIDSTLAESGIQFLGPVNLRPGTLTVFGPPLNVNGNSFAFVRFTVDVPAVSAQTVATLILSNNGGFTTYTGGIVVLPPQ
ncbi:MAG TPA: hypothetical protein VEV17_03725 [Bryobacteraceae bacterium]|nr:hypothetical protein [Bryobacteraceae bacterium]